MKVKNLINKTQNDLKINELVKKINEEEKIKKERLQEQGVDFQAYEPEKSIGELIAETEYYNYVIPILEEMKKEKEAVQAVIAEAKTELEEAKKEYERKTKEPLETIKELKAAESELLRANQGESAKSKRKNITLS